MWAHRVGSSPAVYLPLTAGNVRVPQRLPNSLFIFLTTHYQLQVDEIKYKINEKKIKNNQRYKGGEDYLTKVIHRGFFVLCFVFGGFFVCFCFFAFGYDSVVSNYKLFLNFTWQFYEQTLFFQRSFTFIERLSRKVPLL